MTVIFPYIRDSLMNRLLVYLRETTNEQLPIRLWRSSRSRKVSTNQSPPAWIEGFITALSLGPLLTHSFRAKVSLQLSCISLTPEFVQAKTPPPETPTSHLSDYYSSLLSQVLHGLNLQFTSPDSDQNEAQLSAHFLIRTQSSPPAPLDAAYQAVHLQVECIITLLENN